MVDRWPLRMDDGRYELRTWGKGSKEEGAVSVNGGIQVFGSTVVFLCYLNLTVLGTLGRSEAKGFR